MGLGIRSRAESLARDIRVKVAPKGRLPRIVVKDESGATAVDQYWNQHTVHSRPFVSARESEEYLRRRNAAYPMFTALMDVYGDHAGHVVLDYGCGPGDDVTGFLIWSNARKVIGMDVSEKALQLLTKPETDFLQGVLDTDAIRHLPARHAAGLWHEILRGIFRAQPHLDGMAGKPDVLLLDGQLLAARDAQLQLDKIKPGDRLGDGVLDLETRIHLHEVEIAAGVEQEFQSTGALVTQRLDRGDRDLAHFRAQLRRDRG